METRWEQHQREADDIVRQMYEKAANKTAYMRETFEMHESGMTYREIAQKLGITRQAAQQRVVRYKKLHEPETHI